VTDDDDYADMTPTEREALLVYRLAIGRRVTLAEAARWLRCTRRRAYQYLTDLARVLPICCEDTDYGLFWRRKDADDLSCWLDGL